VPSANLELVRSIFADWQRGDFSSADWAHPEIEFSIADGPAPGSWKGLAEMATGWREFLSAWEDFHADEVDEYRELDGERVLALQRFTVRGKTSGLDLRRMRGANLFHIRGGKVTRLVLYWNREHALADLGLPPDARTERG
jgi:ketosteroid isomerase-like protein